MDTVSMDTVSMDTVSTPRVACFADLCFSDSGQSLECSKSVSAISSKDKETLDLLKGICVLDAELTMKCMQIFVKHGPKEALLFIRAANMLQGISPQKHEERSLHRFVESCVRGDVELEARHGSDLLVASAKDPKLLEPLEDADTCCAVHLCGYLLREEQPVQSEGRAVQFLQFMPLRAQELSQEGSTAFTFWVEEGVSVEQKLLYHQVCRNTMKGIQRTLEASLMPFNNRVCYLLFLELGGLYDLDNLNMGDSSSTVRRALLQQFPSLFRAGLDTADHVLQSQKSIWALSCHPDLHQYLERTLETSLLAFGVDLKQLRRFCFGDLPKTMTHITPWEKPRPITAQPPPPSLSFDSALSSDGSTLQLCSTLSRSMVDDFCSWLHEKKPNLKYVDAQNNLLERKHVKKILSALVKYCPSLEVVDISYNHANLLSEDVHKFVGPLLNLKSLRYLVVIGSPLADMGDTLCSLPNFSKVIFRTFWRTRSFGSGVP